jgi:phosphoglucomutase
MTLDGADDIDIDAAAGTTFAMSDTSTVTIIDPFTEYIEVLKESFDFDAIREFAKHPEFSILFDGMHGAGGPFARRILVEGLGFPEVNTERNFDVFLCATLVTPVIFCSVLHF